MYLVKSSNKLLLGLTLAASATQLFHLCRGHTNFYADLLEKPQYEVVIKSPQIPDSRFDPISGKEEAKSLDRPREVVDDNPVKIMMRNHLGDKFLCTVPTPPPPVVSDTLEQDMAQQDLDKVVERGLELLKPLKEKCIQVHETWWSYEYCHEDYVKQFHLELEKGLPETTVSYILGKYKSSSNKPLTRVQSTAGKKYLAQHWTDGTACDLNGKPRTIEIQFHCNPYYEKSIALINEITTCNYLLIIYTSSLCNDPLFADVKASQHHTIQCEPMVSDKPSENAPKQQKPKKLLIEQLKGTGLKKENKPKIIHLDQVWEQMASLLEDPEFLNRVKNLNDKGKMQKKEKAKVNDQEDTQKSPTKNPQQARIHILNDKDGRKADDHIIVEIIRNDKLKEQPPTQVSHSPKASNLEKMYQLTYNDNDNDNDNDEKQKETPKSEL